MARRATRRTVDRMDEHETIRNDDGRPRVVIAGGGVAALEAILALQAYAGDGVAIDLISPEAQFAYRPLSVLRPFAPTPAFGLDLEQFARERQVRLHRTRLASV